MPGINRTFMELKHICYTINGKISVSINRTFMELKHIHQQSVDYHPNVLIEPLWN